MGFRTMTTTVMTRMTVMNRHGIQVHTVDGFSRRKWWPR